MSKLYDMRLALRDLIVAANIGWQNKTVLIKRQGSTFNDVATAINASTNGAVLHIGVASGEPTEPDSLEMELTIPITLICKPSVSKDAIPEEDLWEKLVRFVHDLRISPDDHFSYRLRFGGFTDLDIEADGGTSYLGRQTIFKKHLSL